MFTPTLRCECAQPGLIDTMRKWCIRRQYDLAVVVHAYQYVASAHEAIRSAGLLCASFDIESSKMRDDDH